MSILVVDFCDHDDYSGSSKEHKLLKADTFLLTSSKDKIQRESFLKRDLAKGNGDSHSKMHCKKKINKMSQSSHFIFKKIDSFLLF
jgi:hypothetical protein